VSTNLANAFAYATNISTSKLKSGNSGTENIDANVIECNMINYLSDIYGPDIEQLYFENKSNLSPNLSNYENLADLSLDELGENNTQEFVKQIFAATKINLKSSKLYNSTSESIQQDNIDKLMSEIENTVQLFMVECIEKESFNEKELNNKLLTTIQTFKKNIVLYNMTSDEQESLLTAISTVENSIGNFISLSLAYSTTDTLKSTNSWLKNLIKDIVKTVVITVCLVGATMGAVVLGEVVCGPPCMIVGGVAGFVGGAIAASSINKWIDKW
jgi:hypothetical protein